MIKARHLFFLIILFFECNSIVFSQFTDTATMRIIDQNKTAFEGDLYLDTNAKVYKIGLSNGKLGFLTDAQDIDSLAIINDSLFVYISRNVKKGIALSSLQKDVLKDTGLTYYTWNFSGNNPPDISLVSDLGVSNSQGITQDLLSDNLRATLEPGNNRFMFRFVGTFKVNNTGTFNFQAISNDGTRIYIDDVLVVNNWSNTNSNNTVSNSVNLAKGEHKIEFWYYQRTGQRFMEFRWGANPDGYVSGSVINASQFFIR